MENINKRKKSVPEFFYDSRYTYDIKHYTKSPSLDNDFSTHLESIKSKLRDYINLTLDERKSHGVKSDDELILEGDFIPKPFIPKPSENIKFKYRLYKDSINEKSIKFFKYNEDLDNLSDEELSKLAYNDVISIVDSFNNKIDNKFNKPLKNLYKKLEIKNLSNVEILNNSIKYAKVVPYEEILKTHKNTQKKFDNFYNPDMLIKNICYKLGVTVDIYSTKLNPKGRYLFQTTGKYDVETQCFEVLVIGINAIGRNSLNNEPKIINIKRDNVYTTVNTKVFKQTCFVRIKNSEKSSKLFGSKIKRKSLINTVNYFNFNNLIFEYNNSKLENPTTIYHYVFTDVDGRECAYKFLIDDLEFLELDSNLVPKLVKKSKIKLDVGSNIKVINDRRLKLFKKGDLGIITSIKKDPNNFLNSAVVIKNKNSESETVFLKQIKLYDSQKIKKEL